MNEFIKTIESIGFKKWIHVKNRYKYNNWFIDITSRITGGLPEKITSDNCWHLTYSDGNPDPLNRVEVTHTFIPIHDHKILKKYFKAELRDIKLNQLLP
jgi:hypothetical protein